MVVAARNRKSLEAVVAAGRRRTLSLSYAHAKVEFLTQDVEVQRVPADLFELYYLLVLTTLNKSAEEA